jgi:Ca2+-transporting ATPase
MSNSVSEDSRTKIQTLPQPEVFRTLGTRAEGLTETEAEERLARYGKNVIFEVREKRLSALAANFTHLMAVLLWAGGLIAFFAGLLQLGIAIWMVNLINGIFSYWQEYRAEKATKALRAMLPAYARVLRDSLERRILAEDLVPGDVIILGEGDRVSADARLVEDTDLMIDQSALTGESRPVRKSSSPVSLKEDSNLIFAGTSVTSGSGVAIVFATGMETKFGKIASLTQRVDQEPSPLQKELKDVTKTVTKIALVVGLAFFFLAVALAGMRPEDSFVFAIGMIAAFVPEGLVPTLTLSLAVGVQRMAGHNALIKKLSVVETLGCTTIICTDKTGTLTQNQMTVSDLWVGGVKLTVTGAGYAPKGEITGGELVRSELHQILTVAGLCNDARLEERQGQWAALGDPTDAALLVVAAKARIDLHAESTKTPRLFELPFDPERKRVTTVHSFKDGRVAYTKGSPVETLNICNRIMMNGSEIPLDDAARNTILESNDEYARRGLRVLAVAMRLLPKETEKTPKSIERDLTFLGLTAMMDPPRPEVKRAVEKCHTAGIRIIMITGDYGLTAKSIAELIGIVKSDPLVLTGTDLDSMDDDALRAALEGEVILARVTPEHKLRVVSVLQGLGHVVAVTGDGVNDAPALRKADIGVAPGSGVDVAKEAADMILADDNFASIVNAVEEGRAVYANIKRFTTYIFTSNAAEAVPFILFALSGGRIPLALNVMQILSVDLGADMVPGLALGAEPPESGVMDKPPRSLREHIITPGLLARSYLFLGGLQSIAAMSAFYFMFWTNGYWGRFMDLPSNGELYQAATAMTLAAIVTTQIGNLFAQRTERRSFLKADISANPLIWIGIASELAIVSAVIYVPQLQLAFGTASLPPINWLFLFALMPLLLVADELRKTLICRWRH